MRRLASIVGGRRKLYITDYEKDLFDHCGAVDALDELRRTPNFDPRTSSRYPARNGDH